MQVVLHEGQLQVANDDHRFRIICAGRRWGKSVLARLLVLQWATLKAGVYWIVSPTYRQGKQNHWLELKKEIPKEWVEKWNEVELSCTLKNGAVIALKGAENPDGLRGVKLRGLVIDEIASIRNWEWLWSEVLRPTLTDYEAPALFISTPKGFNHFYELFEQGQHADSIYKSWRFSSYDNPYIPSSEIDQAKAELPDDTFQQEYLAGFTRFTGLIYKEFLLDRHVHSFEHTYNQHGDYQFGLDFAVRGWVAMICTYIDTNGEIWHLDEYKVQGLTATEHATAIINILKLYAPLEKWTGYADPSGFNKTQQSAIYSPTRDNNMLWSLADEYLEAGLPIVRANNEVAPGINYVRQLHRSHKIHVHPRLSSYVDEKLQYQWKDQTTASIGNTENPEAPRKINDHLVDAERYELYSKPSAAEELQQVHQKISFPIKFELKITEPEEKFEELDIPSPFG